MKVVVRFNPHHLDAEDVVGTILTIQRGAGFGGADLAVVRYTHPRSGKAYTMPFAFACVAPVEARAVPGVVEHHEGAAVSFHASTSMPPC